jgi:hypothetical protein
MSVFSRLFRKNSGSEEPSEKDAASARDAADRKPPLPETRSPPTEPPKPPRPTAPSPLGQVGSPSPAVATQQPQPPKSAPRAATNGASASVPVRASTSLQGAGQGSAFSRRARSKPRQRADDGGQLSHEAVVVIRLLDCSGCAALSNQLS